MFRVWKRLVSTEIKDIKRGSFVVMKSKLWQVLSSTHHTQGRGGAHYKLELKDILMGSKTVERVNSGTSVEEADLDRKNLQFLYSDDGQLYMMDEQMETLSFPKELLGVEAERLLPFLTDEMKLEVMHYQEKPVLVKVPEKATFLVQETQPPLNSSSDSSRGTVFKSAILENGAHVQVPEFVKSGDKIIMDLTTLKYKERIKQ